MPVIKPVDLTKPKFDWRWLLSFFVILVILMLIFGVAMWVSNTVKTAVAGPKGSKRRLEEPKM